VVCKCCGKELVYGLHSPKRGVSEKKFCNQSCQLKDWRKKNPHKLTSEQLADRARAQRLYRTTHKGKDADRRWYRSAKKRRETKKWREENQQKSRAERLLNAAIKRGDIQREPCVFCEKDRSFGHHEDYDKPFDVIWMCVLHHNRLHHGRLCLLPQEVIL